MTAKDRLEIIRAKVGKPPQLQTTKANREGCKPTGRPFQLRLIEGLKPKSLNVHSEWLKIPPGEQKREEQPPQRKGPHYLTKIAEQLPAKLPRL